MAFPHPLRSCVAFGGSLRWGLSKPGCSFTHRMTFDMPMLGMTRHKRYSLIYGPKHSPVPGSDQLSTPTSGKTSGSSAFASAFGKLRLRKWPPLTSALSSSPGRAPPWRWQKLPCLHAAVSTKYYGFHCFWNVSEKFHECTFYAPIGNVWMTFLKLSRHLWGGPRPSHLCVQQL